MAMTTAAILGAVLPAVISGAGSALMAKSASNDRKEEAQRFVTNDFTKDQSFAEKLAALKRKKDEQSALGGVTLRPGGTNFTFGGNRNV